MVSLRAGKGSVAACAAAVLPVHVVVAVTGAVLTAARGHTSCLNFVFCPLDCVIARRRAHVMVVAFARLPIAACEAAVLTWIAVVAVTGAPGAAAWSDIGSGVVSSKHWG